MDRDSATSQGDQKIQRRCWIKWTQTSGHDPQANGSSEQAIAMTKALAQLSTADTDRASRERIWSDAMCHAAYALTAGPKWSEFMEEKRRIKKSSILPFGAKVLAVRPSAGGDPFKEKFSAAIYVHPSPDVPRGHVLYDAVTMQYFTSTSVRLIRKKDGTPDIAKISFPDAIMESTTVTLGTCSRCGKKRPVKPKNKEFGTCDRLQGLTCDSPTTQGTDPIPLKRGRPAHVNDTHAEDAPTFCVRPSPTPCPDGDKGHLLMHARGADIEDKDATIAENELGMTPSTH